MGGVARQEDPPLGEPLGRLGRGPPPGHPVDRDLQVVHPGTGSDELDQPFGAGVGGGVAVGPVVDGVDHQEAAPEGPIEAEEAAEARVVDVDHAERPAPDPG